MDKTVNKLINILEQKEKELILDLKKSYLKTKSLDETLISDTMTQLTHIGTILKIFRAPREDWKNLSEVFVDFDVLSDVFKDINLNARELIYLVMMIFERNIDVGILNPQTNVFDGQKLSKHKYSSFDDGIMDSFIHSTSFRTLLHADEENLTEEELRQREELENATELYSVDGSFYQEKHQIIKDCYFDKIDSFDENDVEKIIIVLLAFKMDLDLASKIRSILLTQVEKRRNKASREPVISDEPKHKQVENKIMPKKEYNVLLREINKYFDYNNMVSIRFLSTSEMIELTQLLIKIGCDTDKINKILKSVTKYNLQEEKSCVSRFANLYSRYSYYSTIPQVCASLETMKQIVEEMFICGDTEYLQWKEMLEAEMSSVEQLISGNFEFEKEMASNAMSLKG